MCTRWDYSCDEDSKDPYSCGTYILIRNRTLKSKPISTQNIVVIAQKGNQGGMRDWAEQWNKEDLQQVGQGILSKMIFEQGADQFEGASHVGQKAKGEQTS